MKHIMKFCFCLLCVLSVFLYSSVSYAANTANFSVDAGGTKTGVLVDSLYGDTNNPYNYYTFSFYINPRILLSTPDVYVNGSLIIDLTLNIVYPNDYVMVGQEAKLNYNSTANFYVFYNQNYRTLQYPRFTVYFDNFWSVNGIDIGQFEYNITLRCSNNVNPPNSVLATPSISIVNNNTSVSAIPITGQDSALIIKQCIEDALSNAELDLVYDYLTFWKTTQDAYLADIELSVDDIETWLSYINSVQVSQDNKLELIRQLISTFPTYSSQMLNYMQQILTMNASQAAQAASNAAAQATQADQASQAMAAANDFAKPDIGAMNIDPLDYVSADGFSGISYILGSILNIPTVLSMLLICVTCAFIGYALYGKKG